MDIARVEDNIARMAAFLADKARFDRMAKPFKPGLDPGPQPVNVEETLLSSDAPSDFRSTRNPDIGRKLRYFGDYELLEEIARGGMGIVYRARQVSLDRIVAVKMLLAGPLAGKDFVQRFRTEAAAAASLQHVNIVAIHEVGFAEGQHFFAMDYVEGLTLAQLVAKGPLTARQAATYLKTIAEAIHFAHQRGTLHRDLKPSNVLLTADGDLLSAARVKAKQGRLSEAEHEMRGALLGVLARQGRYSIRTAQSSRPPRTRAQPTRQSGWTYCPGLISQGSVRFSTSPTTRSSSPVCRARTCPAKLWPRQRMSGL
jgi:serine/threonine protein kinase